MTDFVPWPTHPCAGHPCDGCSRCRSGECCGGNRITTLDAMVTSFISAHRALSAQGLVDPSSHLLRALEREIQQLISAALVNRGRLPESARSLPPRLALGRSTSRLNRSGGPRSLHAAASEASPPEPSPSTNQNR
jgi:hypothetical protein